MTNWLGGDVIKSLPGWAGFLLIMLLGLTAVSISAAITNDLTLDWDTTGDEDGELLGNAVATAGDVNGDGFDDIVIGAHRADPNGGSSGSSYVVFGANFTGGILLSRGDFCTRAKKASRSGHCPPGQFAR